MLCCRKTVFWTLLLIIIILGCATRFSMDGERHIGQYASVEEYLLLQVDSNKTESLAVWDIPFVVMAEEPVEVAVIDRKLDFLEHYKNLDESTTDGTLETWSYNWLIKIDASEESKSSIVLNARGMDEDGYFSQTTGQYVLVVHYLDGSYDVLGEVPYLDALDFLAQHNDKEESIFDWYRVKREYFS